MASRKACSLLVAATLFAVSDRVMARGDSWYVAAALGATHLSNETVKQAGVDITAEFNTGVLGSLAVGHTFGGLRAEGEFTYTQNELTDLNVPGLGKTTVSGDVSVAALMANVYYDFNADSRWRPFIGAGAGYAHVSINNLTAFGMVVADDTAGAIVYQLKTGIGYAFTDSLEGILGYRFLATGNADFTDTGGTPFTASGGQFHVIEFGVRYRF
jgi:opacity protein-like surface antigen